jgi:hypothetical protein
MVLLAFNYVCIRHSFFRNDDELYLLDTNGSAVVLN